MRSLLLAGGRSSRMGRDKALVVVDGSTMIERMAISLAAANLEPIRIAVSQPEDVEDYGLAIGSDLDIEWVLDSRTHAGPIDAIEEALLDPDCDGDLLQLATVDYPWASPNLFASLQESLRADDFLIMPHDGERSHPLLSLIRTREVLEIIEGDRRPLRIQFAEVKHSILMEDPAVLLNVNTPEDLE
ncbi:MAG: molybdenum cofactor guanylyltransferase [Candidatus Thermoplasmatota archaeon]|nr:molybdenum cofactor guanylyltransferase [Candidatus Thermoplasmatota archaeon]